MSGPLEGLKILELAGVGAGTYAGMLLSDLGADVLRIERLHVDEEIVPGNFLLRSRTSVRLDLESEVGRSLLLELSEQAEVLIEDMRAGTAERLGIGPEHVLDRNPRLVYGRLTEYGQNGPQTHQVGHDINCLALSGALWTFGRAGDRPLAPLNLVGEYGGGALFLVFGVIAAVLSARISGKGQVVDAAMLDGAASMLTMTFSLMSAGRWMEERGVNILDTGAHFYEVYDTKDGKYIAVGAIEAKFYTNLIHGLGLDPKSLPSQMDRQHWPRMKKMFEEIFKTKTREEWVEVFAGVDACVSPVLSPREAAQYSHNLERNVFAAGPNFQPRPAPRFSKTPTSNDLSPHQTGSDAQDGLRRWGIGAERQEVLRVAGALG